MKISSFSNTVTGYIGNDRKEYDYKIDFSYLVLKSFYISEDLHSRIEEKLKERWMPFVENWLKFLRKNYLLFLGKVEIIDASGCKEKFEQVCKELQIHLSQIFYNVETRRYFELKYFIDHSIDDTRRKNRDLITRTRLMMFFDKRKRIFYPLFFDSNHHICKDKKQKSSKDNGQKSKKSDSKIKLIEWDLRNNIKFDRNNNSKVFYGAKDKNDNAR